MLRLVSAKAASLLSLALLSATGIAPAHANWFQNPNINRSVGSAPNPTTQDILEYRSAQDVYPAMSRVMREQGKVELNVSLTENGAVSEAVVKRTSGFARLDDAAARYIKANWRYPSADAGKPMPKTVLLNVDFALK